MPDIVALSIESMAAPSIQYRPEHASLPVDTPAEPRQNTRQSTPSPDIRATLQELTDVARDLPAEQSLCLEIEKPCLATLTIDDAFYDIAGRLSDASMEQNKRDELYDTCHTLETQWDEHHKTYKDLLWRSREFAGEAQAVVDDFRELVLPSLRDPDMTRSEKQEIIRSQIKILQDTAQPSQKLCQDSLDFGRALDTYVDKFSRVVESLGIGEQNTKVDGLEDRLRSAKGAIEVASQEVKELGCKFATDVAVAGIALMLAFVIPALWTKLANASSFGIDYTNVKNSGLQFLEARRRCDVVVTEYNVTRAECDLERACLNQMVKLESTFYDSRPLVQEVTIKLGIFASVWAVITADIRRLRNSLHLAEDTTSQLFLIRVQRLVKLYGYLSRALFYYQVTVRLPH